MKKIVITLLLFAAIFMLFPHPEAKAMEPVTIALLAPVAIKAAEKAQPYVMRGLVNGGKGMLLVGKDILDIFRLPLGFLEVTLGAPFGFFKEGIKNVVLGTIAPFKMAFHTIMLPVMFCGVEIN
jgi:hypothetical protein